MQALKAHCKLQGRNQGQQQLGANSSKGSTVQQGAIAPQGQKGNTAAGERSKGDKGDKGNRATVCRGATAAKVAKVTGSTAAEEQQAPKHHKMKVTQWKGTEQKVIKVKQLGVTLTQFAKIFQTHVGYYALDNWLTFMFQAYIYWSKESKVKDGIFIHKQLQICIFGGATTASLIYL